MIDNNLISNIIDNISDIISNNDNIDEKDTTEKLKKRIEKYKDNPKKYGTIYQAIEFIANPDYNGKSIIIEKEHFKNSGLNWTNGNPFLRKNSPLHKIYKIEKIRRNNSKKGDLIGFKFNGFIDESKIEVINRRIDKNIREQLLKHDTKCVLHFGKKAEHLDHKNGRYNNPRVNNRKTQLPTDFQPMSDAANSWKREMCIKCAETNIRFDAKQIGFNVSYIYRSREHDGSINGCVGCFLFDPVLFRSKLKM